MRYSTTTALIAALAGALASASLHAQVTAASCASGEVAVMSLGIAGLSCSNCTLFTGDPGTGRWEFRSEPTVLNAKPGGPADGKLRPGDVIVAIDGYLITTREGGRRILRPDGPTELRVRRDGREISVSITPAQECEPQPRRNVVVRRPTAPVRRGLVVDSVVVRPDPEVRVVPAPTAPVAVPLLPSGWLGLSFQCSECALRIEEDSARVWSFSEPPLIVSVEAGSPASRAGLRSGDQIVTVEGDAITSSEGGRRFGAITPGDRVVIGYTRDGRSRTATVTAGNRVRVTAAPAPPAVAVGPVQVGLVQPETVRFDGSIGDTMVQVTGEPITVTQTETEIIIRSRDITVRIRKDTGGSP